MKTATSAVVMAAVLLGWIGVAALLTGCQSPGGIVSAEASPRCPTCRTETRTTPIKGLYYRKHVCPSCRKVEVGEYDDGDVIMPVYAHVCDQCNASVLSCPSADSRRRNSGTPSSREQRRRREVMLEAMIGRQPKSVWMR